MRPDYRAAATLVASLLLAPPVSAEAPLLTLQNNPFTRPQILAVKPPPAKTQNTREAAPVKLRLSATMVSDTAPMVIADGELLAVGDSIKGLGASPGRVTATARVLHGPEDFDQMAPGDILVAGITTPAWTPLFAMAAGVVTDVGGPLSHGSIVAREYGIPAVLGTGVATKRIRNGQVITVDGSAGMVVLSE